MPQAAEYQGEKFGQPAPDMHGRHEVNNLTSQTGDMSHAISVQSKRDYEIQTMITQGHIARRPLYYPGKYDNVRDGKKNETVITQHAYTDSARPPNGEITSQ